MRPLTAIHDELRATAVRAAGAPVDERPAPELVGLLDGAFAQRFRAVVTLKDRQVAGTYFTPSKTAQLLVANLPIDAPLIDPSCGAGDLLIAQAARLPASESMEETLTAWAPLLRGVELRASLVRVCKLRLMMAALLRGARPLDPKALDERRWFPQIRVGNALAADGKSYQNASIATNPPFGTMKARRKDDWSTGKVARAAVHMATTVANASPGVKIAALLPDVLRSGSRYNRWRAWIAHRLIIDEVQILGAFDDSTDVDVFLLRGTVRKEPTTKATWPSNIHSAASTVQDRFRVSVGSVVPHRDPKSGPKRRYIHARIVRPWTEVQRIKEKRRYDGVTVEPPFVVIRRTSSPSDRRRATAAIILGKGKVAVENHLLIAKPHDATETACRALLAHLNTDVVDKLLNERIRCRHLTVRSIRDLPFRGLQ